MALVGLNWVKRRMLVHFGEKFACVSIGIGYIYGVSTLSQCLKRVASRIGVESNEILERSKPKIPKLQ